MKLLVTDLDGTLLDEMTTFSDINKQALLKAKTHGYEIVIASGRMRENMSELGVDVFTPYAIAMNGAIVYDQNRKILYEKYLSYEQTKHVFSYCEAHNLIYLIYTQNNLYIHLPQDIDDQIHRMSLAQAKSEKEYEEHKQFFHSMYDDLDQIDDTVRQAIQEDHLRVYKMEIISFDDALLERIDHEFSSEFSVSCSWMTNRELTAANVNKGTALKILCDYLGLDLSNCVAMGDNRNDIEMLEYTGYSIAMDNASDEIKQLCDYVNSTCDEHGVASAVEHILYELNS